MVEVGAITDPNSPCTMASTLQPPEIQPSHPMSRGPDDRAGYWARANGRVLGTLAGIVVVVGLGGLLWQSSERSKAQRAERAYFEAQAAAQGGPAATERAMRPLSTRYSGTAGGAQAVLLLVQSLFDQGKYPEGLQALERADVPDEFAGAARLLRAAGLEGAGRPAEAARVYEQLATDKGTVARRRDELRAAAARAYQLAGDRTSALRLWQQIVGTSAANELVDEARVRVGELGARS